MARCSLPRSHIPDAVSKPLKKFFIFNVGLSDYEIQPRNLSTFVHRPAVDRRDAPGMSFLTPPCNTPIYCYLYSLTEKWPLLASACFFLGRVALHLTFFLCSYSTNNSCFLFWYFCLKLGFEILEAYVSIVCGYEVCDQFLSAKRFTLGRYRFHYQWQISNLGRLFVLCVEGPQGLHAPGWWSHICWCPQETPQRRVSISVRQFFFKINAWLSF
jgi:hypothetical protein